MGNSKKNEYEIAIKIAGEIEKSFGSSLGLTKRELYNLSRVAVTTNSTFRQQFSSAFEIANSGFERVGHMAKEALGVAAKVSAAGLTVSSALGAAAVNVGSSYESQMSSVRSITQASDADMKKLKETAEEMGANTVFSATQAGEAMEYMAMAGWKTQEMVDGIGGVINLAAASGEDLATVSDIVTDSLTAFGKTAGDSGHFADVLAAASSNANTNVSMMGETFKYVAPVAGAMNYSIEDTAEVIGLMANSGIKATQAGTSLRSIFTRLAKPTADVKSAMDSLGVSVTNADGTMKPLNDVVASLRTGFSELSESEKTQAAATIAGQEAMSGLLAIVNASDTDVNKLANAINNCSGAAEKMSQVRLDNLKGDFTLLKSATEGLGIDTFDSMNPVLRSGTQLVTGYVNSTKEYLQSTGVLDDFFDNLNAKIPTFIREVRESGDALNHLQSSVRGSSLLVNPLIEAGEWIAKHPDVIKSSIVGIGTSLVSFKVASKVRDVTKSIQEMRMVLSANPLSMAIGGIGVAVGVFSAIRTEIRETNERLKKENLAEHFGDITLSLQELEEVSNDIVSTNSLKLLNDSMSEFSKADSMKQGIEDTISSLNKMDWKVGIGLELSEDEKSQYQSDVSSFITQTQDLILQDQYAMSLNLQVFTDDDAEGQKIRDSFNAFYTSNYNTVSALGTQLQQAVNDAFSDGLLTIDEAKTISDLQTQMSDIAGKMADAQFDAGLDTLGMKYGGGDLDAESFKNLQSDIHKKIEEARTNYDDQYTYLVSNAKVQLEEGAIDDSEYEREIREFKGKYLENIGEINLKATNFELGTISEQYNDEISGIMPKLKKETSDSIQGMVDYINTEFELRGNLDWDVMFDDLKDVSKGLDSDTRAALAELYEQLAPDVETLNDIKQQCIAAGQEVPESVSEGLLQAEQIGTLAGNEEAMWMMISDYMTGNPEYNAALQKAVEAGGYVPEKIAEGMKAKDDACNQALNDLFAKIRDDVNMLFGTGIDVNVPVRTQYEVQGGDAPLSNNTISKQKNTDMGWVNHSKSNGNTKTTTSKNTKKTNTVKSKAKKHALGGIYDTPTYGLFAEAGPEALIPLNHTDHARSLWEQAGVALGISTNTQSKENASYRPQDVQSSGQAGAESNSVQYVFSPVYHFGEGSTSKEEVKSATRESFEEWKKCMQQYQKENRRLNF
ncbi:MAG: phage tail tape measure protein [Lachnospiraceae bacterium]|nr:phage tail tape measure protein [Lachnospiraceae bacterium]